MTLRILTDAQWEKIEPLCSGKASERGVTAKDNRLFIEAVLWITQTGVSWRSLPEVFGSWHTVYVRFSRWKKKGIWSRITEALHDEPVLVQLINHALQGRSYTNPGRPVSFDGSVIAPGPMVSTERPTRAIDCAISLLS